jgi:hypothetical protein
VEQGRKSKPTPVVLSASTGQPVRGPLPEVEELTEENLPLLARKRWVNKMGADFYDKAGGPLVDQRFLAICFGDNAREWVRRPPDFREVIQSLSRDGRWLLTGVEGGGWFNIQLGTDLWYPRYCWNVWDFQRLEQISAREVTAPR